MRTFTLNDPELLNRTLRDLDVSLLFARENIMVADGDNVATLQTAQLTRIDLGTDQLSVWDFPFVLGAPVELSEAEHSRVTENSPSRDHTMQTDAAVFLDITMFSGLRYFFWMQVVGGLPALRLNRIYAMLKANSLVFGLRTGGIGILNLINLTHFAIHPEPQENMDEVLVGGGHRTGPAKFQVARRLQSGEPQFVRLT